MVRELMGESPFGSDVPFQNAMMVAEDVARLRYSLTPRNKIGIGGWESGSPWRWKKH